MLSRKLFLGLTTMAVAFALVACDSGLQSTPTPRPVPTSTQSPGIPTPAPVPTDIPSTPTAVPAPTDSPAVPTFPPPPTPSPQADTNITYERTGGIAGIDDTLQINSQATITYTSGTITRTQSLPITTYAALLQQIDTADFFNLQDNYDSGNVADDVYFTITITQGNRTKTVRAAGAGGESVTPQGLKDLISQLIDIQNTIASTGTTITLATTGGYAGVEDTLILNPDLSTLYTSRGSSSKKSLISGDQYNKVLAQIEKADFFNLKDDYTVPANDAFIFTITVTEPNRTKTVKSSEASTPPQPLQDLISLLRDIQNQVE